MKMDSASASTSYASYEYIGGLLIIGGCMILGALLYYVMPIPPV
jgi:hypothetical protein